MKFWKTPTPEKVAAATAQLLHMEHRRFFFEKLQNPEWLAPLAEQGYFSKPPMPIRDEAAGTVQFPFWPESGYLSRMANLRPDAVLKIILKIETDNMQVHSDFANAALQMSPALAAQFASAEIPWVNKKPHLYALLPEKYGDMICLLGEGGQADAAIALAEAVLNVFPSQAPKETEEVSLVHARGRFESWSYEQIVQKCFPVLLERSPKAAIALLCKLLAASIAVTRNKASKNEREDRSYSWYPNLDESREHDDINGILVTALRDALGVAADKGLLDVPALFATLEVQPYGIFQRLMLWLIRKHSRKELVEKCLRSKDMFSTFSLRREYSSLLSEQFAELNPEARKDIFSWIDAGPNTENFISNRKYFSGKEPSAEEVRDFVERMQRDWLFLIQASLPEEYKAKFLDLEKRLGAPYDARAPRATGGEWVGPTSPKTEAELSLMSDAELVAFLRSWTPSGDHFQPTPEGLGRVLTEVVKKKPVAIAAMADKFVGMAPTYIRGILAGLQQSLGEMKPFDWRPVLNLCQWVVKQAAGSEAKGVTDADPGWGWSKSEVARLIDAGFTSETNAIPLGQRDIVWGILEPLMADADPTPEDEAESLKAGSDPESISINSRRGVALHAIVQYALWVRRNHESTNDFAAWAAKGFDALPEVRVILDAHLDPTKDSSLAIRSVYGRWFPWMVLLDKNWAKNNAAKIFPRAPADKAFRHAAWGAYILFCPAYDESFEILREDYMLAVQEFRAIEKPGFAQTDADERLGQHLVELYWRGKLPLEDDLMKKFWTDAPVKARAEAICFMGRSLKSSEAPIPENIISRFQQLFTSRIEEARKHGGAEKDELKEYGWWVTSGKMTVDWTLAQLLAVLSLTAGEIDNAHQIMNWLVGLVDAHPAEVIQCVDRIVRGDKKGWSILAWRDALIKILRTAIASSAKSEATNLINYLGQKGYSEFGSLLPK